MGTALIAFSSSTSANRLKRLAARANLHSVSLMQTPKSISQNSCTYSLRFDMDLLSPMLALADQNQISHGQVYRETTDQTGRKSYQKM